MKPAPPQTRSFMGTLSRPSVARAVSYLAPAAVRDPTSSASHSRPCRQIPRQSVLPRRHRQDVLALGLERRPCRARRWARDLLAGGRLDAAAQLGLAEYLAGEAVPGDPTCAGQVDETAHLTFEQ